MKGVIFYLIWKKEIQIMLEAKQSIYSELGIRA